MSGKQDQGSYIREKLRGAATTIRDDDGRSILEPRTRPRHEHDDLAALFPALRQLVGEPLRAAT